MQSSVCYVALVQPAKSSGNLQLALAALATALFLFAIQQGSYFGAVSLLMARAIA